MSGKAAIAHHNYFHTWLIKFFCKPSQVEYHKEIVAAADLAFSIMPHIILYFSRTKWTRRPSGPALWGKVQPIWRGCCIATHQERTLYWILGKLFSNSLLAACSITHKRVDAENIGFLLHPAPFYRPRHPDRAKRFVQQSVRAPLHSWHVHPLLGLF